MLQLIRGTTTHEAVDPYSSRPSARDQNEDEVARRLAALESGLAHTQYAVAAVASRCIEVGGRSFRNEMYLAEQNLRLRHEVQRANKNTLLVVLFCFTGFLYVWSLLRKANDV